MAFDEPMEFNEGDVGLSGGIQVLEPSNEHLVTEDSIKRFGGSTAPTAPWPQTQVPEEEQENSAAGEEVDEDYQGFQQQTQSWRQHDRFEYVRSIRGRD